MEGIRTRNLLTIDAIAEVLRATVVGSTSLTISGVDFIERAGEFDLAFVGSARNLKRVRSTAAQAIIAPLALADNLADYPDKTFLLVADAESAFLQVAELLLPHRSVKKVGISSQAVVAESAIIGAGSNVHPLAVIGEDVRIGENCNIASGVVIGDGCALGDNVNIDANVVLYSDVVIGNDVNIKANAVLGGRGYGYRTVNGRHEHLPHVGIVRICDDVHIGACTVIDRAKMGETLIGSGTRVDNLVMIGHNCQIGQDNLLCGQTGIAGSSSTGRYVVCGGQVGIADHVHVGDHAIIGAQCGVHRDLPGDIAYRGTPARKSTDLAREMVISKRLPELSDTIKSLTQQIAELQQQMNTLQETAVGAEPEPSRKAA